MGTLAVAGSSHRPAKKPILDLKVAAWKREPAAYVADRQRMNQAQAQKNEERVVFEAFLILEPTFAGEMIASWHVAELDPPDILCSTVSGRTIGVELGEWLQPEEMKASKRREAISGQLLNAIGSPSWIRTDHGSFNTSSQNLSAVRY